MSGGKRDAAYYLGGITPIGGAQRPIGGARLINDEGDLLTETLVFPNFIVLSSPVNGVMIGDHQVCSPQYAAEFLPALARRAEHVNECEEPAHADKTMTMLDPKVDL